MYKDKTRSRSNQRQKTSTKAKAKKPSANSMQLECKKCEFQFTSSYSIPFHSIAHFALTFPVFSFSEKAKLNSLLSFPYWGGAYLPCYSLLKFGELEGAKWDGSILSIHFGFPQAHHLHNTWEAILLVYEKWKMEKQRRKWKWTDCALRTKFLYWCRYVNQMRTKMKMWVELSVGRVGENEDESLQSWVVGWFWFSQFSSAGW